MYAYTMGGEGNVVSETNKLCGVAAAKLTTPHNWNLW